MIGRRLSLAFALLLAVACAAPRLPAPIVERGGTPAARPYVLLVSFDAFRADYIDRYKPTAISALAAAGVRASALVPSFPSKTFPNHYTLVTGLVPGHHGITGNVFYDPSRRAWYRNNDTLTTRDGSWYRGEPIWVTAERNGVHTATFFWPGSEAVIEGVRPTYFAQYDGRVPNTQRVDQTIAWLRMPAAQRPHLALIYFSLMDDTTHHYGPEAPQTAGAVAALDNLLRRLLDSLAVLPIRDSVNVVLVSDHGMVATPPTQTIPVSDLLVRGGVDTTGVLLSDNGAVMSLWFGADSSRLRRAQSVLSATMTHARAYLRSDAPARWAVRSEPRYGDLMLVADEGWILQRRGTDKAPNAGNHGFDPELPSMQAIFVAAGPNVRRAGVIGRVPNVDVYPFLAALLRLEKVPPVDGSLRVLGSLVQ